MCPDGSVLLTVDKVGLAERLASTGIPETGSSGKPTAMDRAATAIFTGGYTTI